MGLVVVSDEHGRAGGGFEDVVDADVEQGGALVVRADGELREGSERLRGSGTSGGR